MWLGKCVLVAPAAARPAVGGTRPRRGAMKRARRVKGRRNRKARERSPASTSPRTTRLFGESTPDGFATVKPEWVSYCPDCGAKLTAQEHEDCPYFRGKQSDDDGTVTAIECGFSGSPGRRARERR
jgi:hypothetical protein